MVPDPKCIKLGIDYCYPSRTTDILCLNLGAGAEARNIIISLRSEEGSVFVSVIIDPCRLINFAPSVPQRPDSIAPLLKQLHILIRFQSLGRHQRPSLMKSWINCEH